MSDDPKTLVSTDWLADHLLLAGQVVRITLGDATLEVLQPGTVDPLGALEDAILF